MKSKTHKQQAIMKVLAYDAKYKDASVIVIRPVSAPKVADLRRTYRPDDMAKGQFRGAVARIVSDSLLLTVFAGLLVLAGCARKQGNVLRIGVTPGPAGEILESVRGDLQNQGVTLQIVSFTDYIQPDLALGSHDLDANLYQNVAFLSQFNRDHKTSFIEIAKVYLPLMAVYPGKTKTLASLKNGARVAVPNDPVNQDRALRLLGRAGLISVPSHGGALTVADVQNPREFKIVELDAAQLPRSLDDVDVAVINANFALDAGLHPKTNSLFCEGTDSPYANVLSVNAENREDPRIQKLATALSSTATRDFIAKRYQGAIYPAL